MSKSDSEDEVKPAAGAGSAEERCPICLEDYQDKAFIDACFHAFCFGCVVKAVEVTSGRCPLCKTSFDTVIHNVRAIDDYDRYKIHLKSSPPALASLPLIREEAFREFRGYRTTRLPGQPRPQDRESSNASTSSPHMATTAMPSGASGSTGSQLASPRRNSTVKKRKSIQSSRQSRKPAALERRRAVYCAGLRALPIETSDSRRVRVRDISASFFRRNPASTHRLFPWLTREFKVLVGDEHVEFMLQLMQSLIDKIDLESAEFGGRLEPFLHEKTEHFMHELVSFARSPYDMIAYDNKVKYDWPEAHPQAQRQSSEGSAEANSQPQPGPSGMQERVLEEVMLSRWEDSPPLHSGSLSPVIVIHDSSDSEPELYPEFTPSPSRLPTEASRGSVTVAGESEEPPQLTTMANSFGSDAQMPSNHISPPTGLSSAQSRVQSPIDAQTSGREEQTSTTKSSEIEDVALKEHEQTISMLEEGTADEREETVESCPEVSSSAAFAREKPALLLHDEVSSTSENIESVSQPSSSAPAAIQPSLHEIAPLEKATSLLSQDQTQDAEDDGEYFEISLYAEDGGTSLIGEGGTPSSDVPNKKSKKDREKSSRSRKLKKKSRHKIERDGHPREKERKSKKTRHSRNETSSGFSGKDGKSGSGRQRFEEDREKRCKHSHRQRSRSRSCSKTRSHKSHRHDSSEDYTSRSRHRSREGGHSRRKRSRSRSLLRSRRSYSMSCSSDDDGTSGRIRSTVLAKVGKSGEAEEKERRRRHREKLRRDRSDSRSPRRHICSHYRGEHDNERRSSKLSYDTEHRLRGRLYSDDISSEEPSSAPHSSSKFTRQYTSSAHSSKRKKNQRIVNLSLSDEEKQNPQTAASDDTNSLARELNEVDRQIQNNKKELLKSMLRKERIEFLQKSLHGGESSVSGGVLQKSGLATTMKTTGAMEKELELLNRAIVDRKKQLLRVMKKMEEERMEMNED